MKVEKLMTKNPECVTPDRTVQEAARLMRECDCGLLPVIESENGPVVGVITDRDIALRVLGEGRGADTPVREAMSGNPGTCRSTDEVTRVKEIMAERKVRRVPVVDESGRCVGIVAQADLLLAAEPRGEISERAVARVVEKISEPGESPRAGA
jgi:CBS domain-containing protein